jgi:hypothetical protein
MEDDNDGGGTYRIGRYNTAKHRPLVVELMSKKIMKYLIDNKNYFYRTGLDISDIFRPEFLKTKEELTRKNDDSATGRSLRCNTK